MGMQWEYDGMGTLMRRSWEYHWSMMNILEHHGTWPGTSKVSHLDDKNWIVWFCCHPN